LSHYDAMRFSLVLAYRRLGWLIAWRWRQHVSPKRRCIAARI